MDWISFYLKEGKIVNNFVDIDVEKHCENWIFSKMGGHNRVHMNKMNKMDDFGQKC